MKVRVQHFLFALVLVLPLADRFHVANGDMDSSVPDKIDAGMAILEAALDILKDVDKIKDLAESISSFLGPASAVLGLILAFIPQEDSAELKYMKASFTQMFHQLDSIEEKVESLKTVVEWENQRANYMRDFERIDYSYLKAQDMMTQLDTVRCEVKAQCLRDKISIASPLVTHFDVDQHVYNLLVGTIQRNALKSHLPSLIATNSKCEIAKLREFQQTILAAAFKGQVVGNLHAKLTGSRETTFSRNEQWTARARAFQDAVEAEIMTCYKSITTYIKKDVEDKKYQKSDYSTSSAASAIETALKKKYTWIDWIVIAAKGDDDNKFHREAGKWNNELPGTFENTPDSEAEASSKKIIVALPIEKNKQCQGVPESRLMENQNWIVPVFMDLAKIRYSRCRSRCGYRYSYTGYNRRCSCTLTFTPTDATVWDLFKKVVDERGRKVNYPFLGLIYRHDGHYGYAKRGDLSTVRTLHDAVLQPTAWTTTYLMLAFSQPNCPRPAACTRAYCSNNGECTRLPYSTTNYCQCLKGYSGAKCETKTQVKQIEDLMSMALTVPQIHDVAFSVQDLQNTTSAEFLETRSLILTVERRLMAGMQAVSRELSAESSWGQLLTKYYSAVKNINHAVDIYKDSNQTSTFVTREDWAKYVTRVDGMGLWLKQYHKMMTGKDTEIFGDDPLMLQLLTRRWSNKCSEDYKKSMTNAWTLMLGTQLKGYLALEDAFKTLNLTKPNYDGAKLLKHRIEAQSDVFQEKTCRVDMANSVNLQNCVDPKVPFGFIPSTSVDIQCNANHFSVQERFTCNMVKPMVASMSSTKIREGYPMYPYFAVDATFPTTWNQTAETETENHPWLQVDFGFVTNVKRVTLYANKDVANSLQSGTITVGDDPAQKGKNSTNPVCGKWNSQPALTGYIISVTCPTPLKGRYAIFQSDTRDLRIAEVQFNTILEFQSGSATATSTRDLGNLELQACYQKCKTDGGNGITRLRDSNSTSSSCKCNIGMTGTTQDTNYKSAFFTTDLTSTTEASTPIVIEDTTPYSSTYRADADLFQKNCDGIPVSNNANYWLGQNLQSNTSFILDLGTLQTISEISLVNAHNQNHNDRGTKDFEIQLSSNQEKWITAVNGTLASQFSKTCNQIPTVNFTVPGITAKYLRFIARTNYLHGSGLNHISWKSVPVAAATTRLSRKSYYEFTGLSGCQPCNCDATGSNSLQCAASTGICQCKHTHCGPKCRNKSCDSVGAFSACIKPTETCRCRPGYCGERCDHKTCSSSSTNSCVPKNQACNCNAGIWGDTCQYRRCDAQGSNYASPTPINGQCPCNPGWSGQSCNCRNCHAGHSDDTCADRYGNCRCKPLYKGNLCQHTKSIVNNVWLQNTWGCYAWNYWIRLCGPLGCCNTWTTSFIERSTRPSWGGSWLGECQNKDLGSTDIRMYVQTDRHHQFICVSEYGWSFQGVAGSWHRGGIDDRRGAGENNNAYHAHHRAG